MLRRVAPLVVIVAALVVATGAAQSVDFVVIVHPENPDSTLQRARVDGMFLGKINQFSDGTDVQPVQNNDAQLSEGFSQAIHSRSYQAVMVYWSAMAFKKFKAMPPKLTDADVVSFVRDNRGAIGYVSATANIDGVRTVTIVE